MTKGACGCGSEPNPPDFWTKSKFTAAGNAMMVKKHGDTIRVIWIKRNIMSPPWPTTPLPLPDGPRWSLELLVPLELWTLLPAVQVRPDVLMEMMILLLSGANHNIHSWRLLVTIFDKHIIALAARQTENHQLKALALLFSWRTGKSFDYFFGSGSQKWMKIQGVPEKTLIKFLD